MAKVDDDRGIRNSSQVTVSHNGTLSTFVYDGDGNRVKKITDNGTIETTLYVNQYYEKNLTTSEVTTYYYLGDRLVASKKDSTLRYHHQDHLTGTSLMTDSSGGSLGTISYKPWGETRSGSVPTDNKFTGQRLDSTELYFYNSRYYDPSIGRFISADTIVPDPTNPQAFNRYSYVLNNPLKYVDPSGHGGEGYIQEGDKTYVIFEKDGKWWVESPLGSPEGHHRSGDYDSLDALKAAAPDGVKFFIDKPDALEVIMNIMGQANTKENTGIGLLLASSSGSSSTVRSGPGGTIIVENVDSNSPTGKFMSGIGATTVTFGYVILSGQSHIDDITLEHELGHVMQAAALGPLYIPLYIFAGLST